MKNRISLTCLIAALTAALWPGITFANSSANETTPVSPCFSTDPKLGDSAFWASTASQQFADRKFADAVATVDACFMQWGPEAGQQQTQFNNDKTSCPKTGKVSRMNQKLIEKNYLVNDVSMALWAKARSLDELGQIEPAKKAYSQCIYMACGRAWDPKGWYWSPAQDCITQARKMLEENQ